MCGQSQACYHHGDCEPSIATKILENFSFKPDISIPLVLGKSSKTYWCIAKNIYDLSYTPLRSVYHAKQTHLLSETEKMIFESNTLMNKKVISSDLQEIGNVVSSDKESLIILRGTDSRYVIPKSRVAAFIGELSRFASSFGSNPLFRSIGLLLFASQTQKNLPSHFRFDSWNVDYLQSSSSLIFFSLLTNIGD